MKGLLVALTLCMMSLTPALAQNKEKPADVAGMWKMTWQGRNGAMEATLKLEQNGENAKGVMNSERGGDVAIEATIKGKEIKFMVTRETPRGTMNIEYSGTVNGDTMKGVMGMGQFSNEWTAARIREEKKKE